jgi:DNA sulfur modification protein DndB
VADDSSYTPLLSGMLDNIASVDTLRGLARRKSQPDNYKTVRNPLVEEEVAAGWEIAKKNKASTRLRRAKSHDKALEDRVWTLMYRMGFSQMSQEGGAFQLLNANDPKGPDNQIDVVALDDEVALAIECKSSTKPKKFADFSADLAKHVALRDSFTKTLRSQFPSPHKRPTLFAFWTAGIIPTQNDRDRATDAGVPIFTEAELEYYEALVGQIGVAARFQFLADVLQGRKIPGLELRVPAIKTKMGKFMAYTFSVAPEYLLKIAFVSHRAKGKASDIDAYQRMLKKSRLRDIRQYIADGGIFPTNIVLNVGESRWLSFDRGKQEAEQSDSTFGWLMLRPAYRVAWIIDGQHRLFAYAGQPAASKAVVSVLAFVGLPPSEQARLFVDINAEQRKVKQSLLQELYAELHWDAAEPEVRVQAVLSKVVQALDSEPLSPFFQRVLKADDKRTEKRCISLTAIFGALEKGTFFIARTKGGLVTEYGPLWDTDNSGTLRRTVAVLSGYFESIRAEAASLWDLGAGDGGGLAMNDGVTVCINVLKSIFVHLEEKKHLKLADLGDSELVEVLQPYAQRVGRYFSSLTPDQVRQFRALRGIQGQTTGLRRVQASLRAEDANFDPSGLSEFLNREKAQTTTKAFEVIQRIETVLQQTIIGELKREIGPKEEEWWFTGVPKGVRKKVDERRNEEGGKNTREQNFDLIDYREIIQGQWQLFEPLLARGKGSKDARTKWLVEVNELRKPIMHASKGVHMPISEEQLNQLEEIEAWLTSQLTEDPSEPLADIEE